MNEIEKMFENAKVGKQGSCPYICTTIPYHNCKVCKYKEDIHYYYPPFTAEKQIELIKWLIASGECYFAITIKPDEFEEYLAKYINNMWKDLADIDKEQIKEILK